MSDSPITDAVLEKISSHIGASSETLQKVKFGRGTVGKLAIVGVFAVASVSLATLRLNGALALFGIGAIVVITLAVLGLICYVVIARPELAVLEGTELVMYKQVTLGIKDTPVIVSAQPVLPVPGNTALLSDKSGEEESR
jgi:hypothetical protein